MAKLPKEHTFLDLSDYGRPVAKEIARKLKNTSFTPIHITIWFMIAGLIAVTCILLGYYWFGAFFLILKSILDAADGELARVKKTPSHTGRYLDSVCDIILNLIIILSIRYVCEASWFIALLAFVLMQLQGTLYNYYYVILRNRHNGDKTSRVFENKTPIALPGEKQSQVNLLFKIYKILYGQFDQIIYRVDKHASRTAGFPNWFMTALSIYGLGFQLLIIAVFLVLGWINSILFMLIIMTLFLPVFIMVRRTFLAN